MSSPVYSRCPRAMAALLAVSVGPGAAGLGVPALRGPRRGARPGAARRGGRRARATAPSSGWCSASAPGCCSTWRRRPTTSPGAGRSRCMVVGVRRRPARAPRAARAVSQWLPGRPRRCGVRRDLGVRAHRAAAARPGRRRTVSCCGSRWWPSAWDVALALVVVPLVLGLFDDGSSPTGSWRDRLDRPTARPQPAAAGGDPGAGLLAVRDAAGPALLPAGRHRRGVHRPGRLAVGPRDRRPAAARADRRRRGPAAGRQPHLVGGLDRPRHPGQDARGRAASAAAPGRAGDRRGQCRGSTGCSRPAATTRRVQGRLLERLADPAGAGRGRRAPADGAAGARAARGLPGACTAEQQSLRAYPRAVRHQPRARARLPQPDHRRRARPGRGRTATGRSTARRSWAGPASRSSTTRGCAGCPATPRSRSTRWAG